MRIECPSGLVGEVRRIKGAELVSVANNMERGSGGLDVIRSVVADCWLETIDAGPYPFMASADGKVPRDAWKRVLLGDLIYSLIFLRSISAVDGHLFEFGVRCPFPACGAKLLKQVSLHDLLAEAKRLPESSKEILKNGGLFEASLECLNDAGGIEEHTVKFALQDGKQDERARGIRKHHKIKKATEVDALAAQIYEVDGKQVTAPAAYDFVAGLELGALSSLRQALAEHDCGLELGINVQCNECDEEFETQFPLATKEFFVPTARKSPKTAL